MPVCAICLLLGLSPQGATGTVGLLTAEARLIEAAVDSLGESGSERHVMVHACSEHVVDVYRERVAGVRMAWRMGPGVATPLRRNPAAVSASQA